MKKRKLFLALALFAMTQAWAQTEWSNATALPTVAGTYKLTTDVTLSETWEAPAGVTTLDLNDHIVSRTFANDDEKGTVIYIEDGNTLNIEDNASSKTTRYWERGTYKEWTNPQTSGSGDYKTVGGCITGGRGDQMNIVDGKLNFRGRIPVTAESKVQNLIGMESTGLALYGGGIVNAGTLNLNGGNVVGNRVVANHPSAGGIMNAGTMTIGESAAVLGNVIYSMLDGGSSVEPSTVQVFFAGGLLNSYIANASVNNGRIEYNHISLPEDVETFSINGAGVYQLSLADFTNNGTISHNSASCSPIIEVHGLGMAVGPFNNTHTSKAVNNGTIEHNDNPGGRGYGNGVFIRNATFTNSGNISNNLNSYIGGGVYLSRGSVFTNTGKISENSASNYGGGIVITSSAGTVTFNAGTKILNNEVAGSEGISASKGYGGGIWAAKAFTINNGSGTVEISSNEAANGGAGIYLNNIVLTLRSNAAGKLTLTGNSLLDGTTASNALLYGEGAKIKIYNANSLKNAATAIGVGIRKTATDETFVPASGVVTADYSKFSTTELASFQLDEALYEGTLLDIYKNSDNEVEIGLKVNDTGSNDAGLSKYDGEKVGVKLSRTLIGDGYYNTICLPFDVDNATLKKRFGDDVELKQMVKSVASSNDIDMTMLFSSASKIEAGKPYLIKVSQDVVDPTFTDVTIKNTLQPKETELCTFVPVFNQTRLENDNKKILFLDAGNTLTWPSSEKYTADFRGLRCYFLLKNEAGAGIGSAKTFRLAFDDETTGIQTIGKDAAVGNEYFNLSGQRVGMPQKGIYIKNGKKFVK